MKPWPLRFLIFSKTPFVHKILLQPNFKGGFDPLTFRLTVEHIIHQRVLLYEMHRIQLNCIKGCPAVFFCFPDVDIVFASVFLLIT